jgi:thiol-disulfide isomerase/thioredoxin
MTPPKARCTASAILAVVFLSWIPLLSAHAAANESAPSLDLSAYRGKVVVVDFWASWCVPCRHSLPWLDAMQQKYADDGLVVIGINEDNAAEDAEAFLKAVPVSFHIVDDRDGAIAKEFDLVAMPSSYVFSRDGEVAVRQLGFKTGKKDEYEAELRRLLDSTPAATGTAN